MKDSIDYIKESEKFRPKIIKTLLIAEAPPSSGKRYFYLPRIVSNKKPIEKDSSLAATIFNHYEMKRPENINQYRENLLCLKSMGIFLIDIIDEPLRIRGDDDVAKRNKEKLIARIPKLMRKMRHRGIFVEDKNITFLLARPSYKSDLREHFPEAKLIPWIKFRLSKE